MGCEAASLTVAVKRLAAGAVLGEAPEDLCFTLVDLEPDEATDSRSSLRRCWSQAVHAIPGPCFEPLLEPASTTSAMQPGGHAIFWPWFEPLLEPASTTSAIQPMGRPRDLRDVPASLGRWRYCWTQTRPRRPGTSRRYSTAADGATAEPVDYRYPPVDAGTVARVLTGQRWPWRFSMPPGSRRGHAETCG
jgi:hypothetical protein